MSIGGSLWEIKGVRRCRLRPDPVLEDRVPRFHIQVEGTRYGVNRYSKEL